METQDKLNIGIGNTEAPKLGEATVKIVSVRIEPVGAKKLDKVVCTVKHPEKEELIEISAVKYLVANQLKVAGLWFQLDSENLIQKGSALQIFLTHYGVQNITQLKDRDAEAVLDEKGYLCFKAYR